MTGQIVVRPYTSGLTVVPKLNIEGGNYNVTEWDVTGNGTISISGGTYTSDPTAYVASGAIARKDGDAQFTVVAKSNLTSGVYTTSPEGAAR